MWNFDRIGELCHGRWIVSPEQASSRADRDFLINEDTFAGVSIDTRTLQPNQVFMAFVGEQVDGHRYLKHAQDSGAVLCIVTRIDQIPDNFACPVLLVEDMLCALTDLAHGWRQELRSVVIAITGSNGKTTSCRMMHALCEQAGRTASSQKSFNNALGVPITILSAPIDTEYLIAEVGTSSHGEIKERVALLKPHRVMIVSIGHAHLEELGGLDGVCEEKAHILSHMSHHLDLLPRAMGCIPDGIPKLDELIALRDIQQVEIKRVNGSEVEIVRVDDDGSMCFRWHGETYQLPMVGAHNASNAVMCITIAQSLGIQPVQIQEGLRQVQPPDMRFERVEVSTPEGDIHVLNDAYNANLDSMQASLRTFDTLATSCERKIAVIGEMLEMGEASERVHQQLVDQFEQFESISQYVLVGGSFACVEICGDAVYIPETDEHAMQRVADLIEPGSFVLLKGSRGVGLERVVHMIAQDSRE